MITSIGIAAYLIAGIIYFGNKKAGYNHYKHTISELAESGSPFKNQVSFVPPRWGFIKGHTYFLPLCRPQRGYGKGIK